MERQATTLEPNIVREADGSFRVYHRAPDARTGKSKKTARRFARGTSIDVLRAYRDSRPSGAVINVRVDRRHVATLRAAAERQSIGYEVLLQNIVTGAAIMLGGAR
jgi:hypothetical protein